MSPQADNTSTEPAELLKRTREHVERAVRATAKHGFSLADIAPASTWQTVLSTATGPAVVAEAVTGAVQGLLPGRKAALTRLESLDLTQLTPLGTTTLDHLITVKPWLKTELSRALGSHTPQAPIITDLLSARAHHNPGHLAALILSVVIVAHTAATTQQ
jgi:hypothetical protein